MYEFIEGEVVALTPTSAVVAAGGVGYLLQISMHTYHALVSRPQARLYTHQVLREDCNDLYGFAETQERALFRLLVSVSGVGANTARMMLSAYEVQELADMIASGDEGALRRVKGIGTKTAQRVIVDLQGKMGALGATGSINSPMPEAATAREEALAALVTLGFQKSASEKVLDQLLQSEPSAGVEQLIKLALKLL